MGTHPIFESDFDCLTECSASRHVPLPSPPVARWIPFRRSLSIRFARTPINRPPPVHQWVLTLRIIKSAQIYKNVFPAHMAVVTWTPFPSSISPPPICTKTPLMARAPSISKCKPNHDHPPSYLLNKMPILYVIDINTI